MLRLEDLGRTEPTMYTCREQEMAGTVIYLVSPAGCYTTGEEILTDGGYIAVNPSMR